MATIVNIGCGFSPIRDVQMSASTKKDFSAGVANSTTFDIQVCSEDGRLLREY
jgi:hypothetical protein